MADILTIQNLITSACLDTLTYSQCNSGVISYLKALNQYAANLTTASVFTTEQTILSDRIALLRSNEQCNADILTDMIQLKSSLDALTES